jgi:hypothetical protein
MKLYFNKLVVIKLCQPISGRYIGMITKIVFIIYTYDLLPHNSYLITIQNTSSSQEQPQDNYRLHLVSEAYQHPKQRFLEQC